MKQTFLQNQKGRASSVFMRPMSLNTFSSQNSYLPTMPDDHTSEARSWLRDTKLVMYSKSLLSLVQLLVVSSSFSCLIVIIDTAT